MKIKFLMLFFVLFFLFPLTAFSTPQYMEIFNKDSFAKPEKKSKCSVCHVSPSGGGPLNDFGKAFSGNGKKITSNIREQFPELFDLLKSLAPKITRIKPKIAFAGQEAQFMILGKNFASDSIVKVDGISENIQSTFVSSKEIDLTISFSETGVHTIQVVSAIGQVSNIFKIKVKPAKT
ncbi:MAG: IPT/TIG domain-containing protein [Candidatus Melainabacteria bacterium]|nr:IPT/TIG domain-containing protein [Candidatus Melainabacteria bacterium]